MQQDKPVLNKQIKNYIINLESQIGKGFSSTVYRGHNMNNEEPVAIKVVDTKGVKTEVEHMLLRNEIRALKMMSHQNVIHTFEVCQTANNVYIITEICQQGDLASLIKDKGPIREEEALHLFKQIIKGLQHIHTKGIIHRDIKSANIFIKNGVLKIADFGFCQFVSEKYGQQGYNVGSPLYMSPEAYKKTQYSDKSDCWAAGVILYEMLIGDTPFKGIDYNTLMKQIASAQIYKNLNISSFTKMILSRMLSLDIERRADANETLNLLRSNQPKIVSEVVRPVSQTNTKQPSLQVPSSFKSKCPEQIVIKPDTSKLQKNILDPQSGNVSPGLNPKKRMCHTSTNIHVIPSESSPKKNQLHPAVAARPSSDGKGIKLEDRVEKARIMVTCCQIFQQSPALVRVYLLCLKHLQTIIKQIEEILRANPAAQQTYKPVYKTISTKADELLSKAQFNRMGTDPYFTYVASEVNPQSQTYSNFAQFWLRTTFEALKDSIQKYQVNPLDKYHLQLAYNTLLYGAKYYKILCGPNKQTAQICNAQYTLDLLLKDTSGPSTQNIQVLSDATRILIS